MARDTVFGIFILFLLLISVYSYGHGLTLLPDAFEHEIKDDQIINVDMMTAKFYICIGLLHMILALVANHLRKK